MSEPSNNTQQYIFPDESVMPDRQMTSASAQATIKDTTEEQSELTPSTPEIPKATSEEQETEQPNISLALEPSSLPSQTMEDTTEESPARRLSPPLPQPQTADMDTTEKSSASMSDIQQTVENAIEKSSISPLQPTIEETTKEPLVVPLTPSHLQLPSSNHDQQLQLEEAQERQRTYTTTLKEQIQYKKKLLKVAKQRLSKLQEASFPTDTRSKTLALLDTLSRLPYHPPRQDLIGSSLLENQLKSQISSLAKKLSETKTQNQTLQNQLIIQTDLSNTIQQLSTKIHKLIETHIKLKREAQKSSANQDAKFDEMTQKIKEMKLQSRKLVGYSKTLIVDYILASEFNIFNLNEEDSAMHNKAKYLKLLESLLNNAIGLTDENNVERSLGVDDKDDPLVRYLIRNNIVVVDRKNPNQIRLRDLTANI
ncbi:unnamed protein product [Ambrosiozyma monospora]|uniref:Unnamed protein product n=1 Tax=Ambrosiozyma monospora TaxID=43982 RepID=A0A9W6YMT8_AMBMO|nr:unnamed protein product [Ambrosiozyma monospora]